MDKYLTKKAAKAHWWDVPVMGVSGVLTLIAVFALRDFGIFDSIYNIIAAVIVLGLFSAPLIAILLKRLRQGKARKVAKCLADAKGDNMTLGKIRRSSGIDSDGLQRLIDKGFLQGVTIDKARDLARFLPNDPSAAAVEAPAAPVMDTGVEAYNEKLRQIRDLNDRISDRPVSRKINRIEELTGDIFRLIAEQPDRANDARRFMNYYLPTTMKLLEVYSLMEKQRYQGKNISESRAQIEATLDKLIQAIERQQDKLFQADAWDVDAEIRVLETMMTSDDLKGQGLQI